jgi:magnesium transporter
MGALCATRTLAAAAFLGYPQECARRFLVRLMSRRRKAGLPPGSLEHVGERKVENVRLTVFDYDHDTATEVHIEQVEECLPLKDRPSVTWLNVDGLHDTETLRSIGEAFHIHPLVLEDILHTDQRPKAEYFEGYVFLVLRMLYHESGATDLVSEQVSLILGDRFVISFQERPGDVFDPIRDRIKNANGRIRREGADYLAYALLDAIVDNYFVVLERVGDRIEALEDELVEAFDDFSLAVVHTLKRDMIHLRRSIWPLREVINSLSREDTRLIATTTHIYLRDVYDHTIQVIDTVESYRDLISGMVDLYMTGVSNRMNQVMKVLTIIATIFIPLTFIAGIYGMNFNPEASPLNMPELNWVFGYPAVLAVMLLVVIGMFLYFKRKKWL